MPSSSPIALYDSGLGGLSVLRALTARLPEESLIYFGDTARVPYGPRPAAEILAFNEEIAGRLVAAGAKALVVACNTSSAIALPVLASGCPVPMVGLIEAGAEAALTAAGGGAIAVIATQATVLSGAYGRAIAARAPGTPVVELACPALVPLVEAGTWAGPVAEAAVREALAPLLPAPPAALVLGCTHYPHLTAAIRTVLPSATLVDPAQRVAEVVAARLTSLDALAPHGLPPAHQIWVSGELAAFLASARRLLPGLRAEARHVPVGPPAP
ncbi:MAG: glutamate racemase [Candidatus Sericytochromatia bacterium]|nr:glutamate racemase [Candidatus Sericytochromatia bacterium]